jgi:hypothetical protein
MTPRVIYKYPLTKANLPSNVYLPISAVRMPIGGEVLTVQLQNNQAVLWALVDPKDGLQERLFITLGTGLLADSEHLGRYIGTYQRDAFVWHVFEYRLP